MMSLVAVVRTRCQNRWQRRRCDDDDDEDDDVDADNDDGHDDDDDDGNDASDDAYEDDDDDNDEKDFVYKLPFTLALPLISTADWRPPWFGSYLQKSNAFCASPFPGHLFRSTMSLVSFPLTF